MEKRQENNIAKRLQGALGIGLFLVTIAIYFRDLII